MPEQDRLSSAIAQPAAPPSHFDQAALDNYLRRQGLALGEEIIVRQFQGGQSNPTYLLQSAGHNYVLRKKPAGTLVATAHAIDREYRVLSALAGTTIPAPKPLLLCEDETIIGQMFYLMEYVPGKLLADLTDTQVTKSDRSIAYRDFATVLARIHNLDLDAAGLQSFGRPGNYILRQIDRLSRQYAATGLELDQGLLRVERWLRDNLPESVEVALVHGDYRPRNVLIAPDTPAVAAVLDWELSTLGHPLADLAYCCLPYKIRDADAEWDAERRVAGVPSEDEFLDHYAAARPGCSLNDYHFFVVFALFRSAVIRAGILARARHATAQSATAAERGMTYVAIVKAATTLLESAHRTY